MENQAYLTFHLPNEIPILSNNAISQAPVQENPRVEVLKELKHVRNWKRNMLETCLKIEGKKTNQRNACPKLPLSFQLSPFPKQMFQPGYINSLAIECILGKDVRAPGSPMCWRSRPPAPRGAGAEGRAWEAGRRDGWMDGWMRPSARCPCLPRGWGRGCASRPVPGSRWTRAAFRSAAAAFPAGAAAPPRSPGSHGGG